jgi:EmrB/QacA subfamily drug resistance transporter
MAIRLEPTNTPSSAVTVGDANHLGAARAVAVVAPAVVLAVGTVAAVNLAIPALGASKLAPSVSATAWIVDSYTLLFACLLIPAGALGDRFGRKPAMLWGLAAFALGSAIAAVAPSVGVLMAGRALSGVGAATVLPATLAVALNMVEPSQRPRTVALWAGLTGIGGVLGNLGGGLAVQLGGWRALFWAAVPIAALAGAVIAVGVRRQTPHRDPVDAGGALLLTVGSVALLYAIIDGPVDGWGSASVLGGFLAALLLLCGFVGYETRRARPMLDPRLFALPGVRAGALGITALFFAMFGLFYVNAQYLQDAKGYSPLLTGVCILPLALVMPVASARSVSLAKRFGARRTVVGGLLCVVAGLGLLSFATAATPYALYGALLALTGVGCGLSMAPLSGLMVHALPSSHAGVGSGLNGTTRELGSALGVAVLSTVLTERFSSHLPGALRELPGARGETVRHSIAAALRYSEQVSAPVLRAHQLQGIRDAFTAGMSGGLRFGAALLLLAGALVAHQHPPRSRES